MATLQEIKDRHDNGHRLAATGAACAEVAMDITRESFAGQNHASRLEFVDRVLTGGSYNTKRVSQASLKVAGEILYHVLMYWGKGTNNYTDAQLGNLSETEVKEAVNAYVDGRYGANV